MSDVKIKKLFKTIFQACQDVKGQDLIALDLSHNESYTDYVIIVSGTSDRQAKALADRVIDESYKKCQTHPLGVEGFESAHWILIDFGDVICHVFFDEVRSVYRLEDMWPYVKPLKESDVEKIFLRKKPATKRPVKVKSQKL